MRVRNILSGSLIAVIFLFTFYLLLVPEHAFMDLDLRVGQSQLIVVGKSMFALQLSVELPYK